MSVGYELAYKLNDGDPDGELCERFQGWAIGLRASNHRLVPGEQMLATIGRCALVKVPLVESEDLPPDTFKLIRPRRKGNGVVVGIDSSLWTDLNDVPVAEVCGLGAKKATRRRDAVESVTPSKVARIETPVRDVSEILDVLGVPLVARLLAAQKGSRAVGSAAGRPRARLRVAVIDLEFKRTVPVHDVQLDDVAADAADVACHGEKAAKVIRLVAGDDHCTVLRYRIPDLHSVVQPIYLAVAIARAVTARAKVVLIPLSSGGWGMHEVLDAVLNEAARLNVSVIGSSGTVSDNGLTTLKRGRSYCVGADELASHPAVLTVGPCDLNGQWMRAFAPREDDARPSKTNAQIRGRLGPGIAIAAPGPRVRVASLAGYLDESSLASAIVAGTVAAVRWANPTLAPHEVRWLLTATAFVPPRMDAPTGVEAGYSRERDRDGHNPKVGAGMVNPFGAVAAALSPVSLLWLMAGSVASPPQKDGDVITAPDAMLAYWFPLWLAEQRAAVEHHATAALRRVSPRLVGVLLPPSPLREQAMWLARHLLAIFSHDGIHGWRHTTHGALLRRVRSVADAAEAALPQNAELQTVVTHLRTVTAPRAAGSSELLEKFVLEAVFGEGSFDENDEDAAPTKLLRTLVMHHHLTAE